jgi:hypothetical protein
MATRAEWFRYDTERSGPKKAKATPKKPHGGLPASHNESARAAKHATYALEDTAGKRPSRKSTRKASNRQKTDVQVRALRKLSEVRPEGKPRIPHR